MEIGMSTKLRRKKGAFCLPVDKQQQQQQLKSEVCVQTLHQIHGASLRKNTVQFFTLLFGDATTTTTTEIDIIALS